MSIVYFTDFLSAFAACATVCLAVMELISRNKVKKATDAIEIYADYLHTIQYMNYAIKSLEKLLKRFDSIDKVEMSSYAKTHVVNDAMFNLIDKIEKNSICNMNYSSKM